MKLSLMFYDAGGETTGTAALDVEAPEGTVFARVSGMQMWDNGQLIVPHDPAPREGWPLFGADTREVAGQALYPLLGTCGCGTPITQPTEGAPWQHC